jgi:repressor LexA
VGTENQLSTRQADVLAYIRESMGERGYAPSIREIGLALGIKSSATVHGHLKRLEAKGVIRCEQDRSRALCVVEDRVAPTTVRVPLVGAVAAGTPRLAVTDESDWYDLPRTLFSQGDLFMLQVKGDSMIDAGIFEGDMVVVSRQEWAQNGEIVVALLPDETLEGGATVKRFYKEGDVIRLQPENARLEPIFTREARILGRVVGVIRTRIN